MMKNVKLFGLLILSVLILTACGAADANEEIDPFAEVRAEVIEIANEFEVRIEELWEEKPYLAGDEFLRAVQQLSSDWNEAITLGRDWNGVMEDALSTRTADIAQANPYDPHAIYCLPEGSYTCVLFPEAWKISDMIEELFDSIPTPLG